MLFDTSDSKRPSISGASASPGEASSPSHHQRSSRRRAWLWKNPLHNSFDDVDIANADRHGLVAPPPSTSNSRRESLCSSSGQASPASGRSPARRSGGREARKQRKDSAAAPGSPVQRLHRVLEEQALGEAIGKLTRAKQQRPASLATPDDDSPSNRFSS